MRPIETFCGKKYALNREKSTFKEELPEACFRIGNVLTDIMVGPEAGYAMLQKLPFKAP